MLQKRLAFTLPTGPAPALADATDWRECFVGASIGRDADWNALRVSCPPGRLGISPASPGAMDWLLDHVESIAAVVADKVGTAVPFEIIERAVGVTCRGEDLFAYQFPRLVIAKGGGDWAGLRDAKLPAEAAGRVLRSIESALRREWTAWNCLPVALGDPDVRFMVLADSGRATIIPAIHAGRSGHGKPVNALVRRHLTVLSPWRVTGDFCAGPLAALGFSRMAHTQAPEQLDRDIQRALLTLPAFDETQSC